MEANLSRFRADIKKLDERSGTMNLDITGQLHKRSGRMSPGDLKKLAEFEGAFAREYQNWYTEAHALVRQLIPDRAPEFRALYLGDGKRRTIAASTYNIQDWLTGLRSQTNAFTKEKHFDDLAAVISRFEVQRSIVSASTSRLESSLHDIRQLVLADMLDSEIAVARTLAKSGFLRPSGAIAGVVLERHLKQVATDHGAAPKKKNPTIGDFNDKLKDAAVIDMPSWRKIQHFSDIRHLCVHVKEREPTLDEINDLCNGVETVTKTIF